MNKKLLIIVLTVILILVSGLFNQDILADELTGEEIMELVDDNQFLASARVVSEMTIIDGDRESVKEMKSYIRSDGEITDALTEFHNPRDRGTRYLMQDDELWMYFPDAEDLVRISGHMLEEGMMGSDFSYQDLLESEQLTKLYEFEKVDRETINEREAYLISATAKEDEEPAYYQRKLWVDVERFVILHEEMYSRDERLLKEMIIKEVTEIDDDRWLPTKMVMEDKLLEDTETIYEIDEIELDYDIPDGKITLDELQ